MIAEIIARGARLLCGGHARWLEEPPAPGPRVFYANHTSHLDSLMVWAALPRDCRRACRIVAAADYWKAGTVRPWLAGKFRAVLIDRVNVTRHNNPLDAMSAVLEAGEALIIFPEGSRGEGDDLSEFRGGLWHLSRKIPSLPFTPVWLENLNRVLPKGEFVPVPVMTALTFGPSLRRADTESKSAFLDTLREQLAALKGRPHG